jgi:hypothetical protein
MPAAVQDTAPSISRIYASFDDDCHRAFRRAMARSRGGVVRVEDLLAALAETLPQRTAAVLGLDAAAVARLARWRAVGLELLPMVNEPALRLVLAEAHVRAADRPITPELLLQAAARSIPLTREPCREATSTPAPRVVRASPSLTAETVQGVLSRWLEVQSWPAAARDRALQELARLAPPRLESEPTVDQRGPAETTSNAPGD